MAKDHDEMEVEFRRFLRTSVATWEAMANRHGKPLLLVAVAVRDMAEAVIRIESQGTN